VKFHHAAALTLVGWYLMVPPQISDSPLKFDYNAPLSNWKIGSSYDTAKDCENGKWAIFEPFLRTLLKAPPSQGKFDALNRLMTRAGSNECISNDDSRLKEK